jgi:hypothetical protein
VRTWAVYSSLELVILLLSRLYLSAWPPPAPSSIFTTGRIAFGIAATVECALCWNEGGAGGGRRVFVVREVVGAGAGGEGGGGGGGETGSSSASLSLETTQDNKKSVV